MKPDDLLNDEFLKQFNNGPELTSFLEQLHKRGIEKILEGELDAHLDLSFLVFKTISIVHLYMLHVNPC